MISVACVWVKGNVPYSADYVARLYSMAVRHLRRSFEFVCLTDNPAAAGHALPAVVGSAHAFRVVAIPAPEPLAGWWSKLELFNAANGLFNSSCVLYLDLDVLIVGDLAPLLDFKVDGRLSPFALVPPGGSFRPHGYRTVTRYNSSVMVFQPSARLVRLYTDFDKVKALPSGSRVLPYWGDQDWIGDKVPDADTMPAEWFPRLGDAMRNVTSPSATLAAAREAGARVVLVKKPKPHVAAAQWPWFAEAWR